MQCNLHLALRKGLGSHHTTPTPSSQATPTWLCTMALARASLTAIFSASLSFFDR